MDWHRCVELQEVKARRQRWLEVKEKKEGSGTIYSPRDASSQDQRLRNRCCYTHSYARS
jgi:hypothetical protein